MQRAGYTASLREFLQHEADTVLGALARSSDFPVDDLQRNAWIYEISHLKRILPGLAISFGDGLLHFEYAIPRMGKRIDVLLLIRGVLFVIEYKVGESNFTKSAADQVVDYALDLKNFHEASHDAVIAPILVATDASVANTVDIRKTKEDLVLAPMQSNADTLGSLISKVMNAFANDTINPEHWVKGRYQPTPTIVEAATALYAGHRVEEISRSDAGAINLAQTSARIEEVITSSRARQEKVICFVTGVPGAGKTLVGLNVATKHIDPSSALYSVFLSGNGPLVKILHEALARDRVEHGRLTGNPIRKGEARSQVKAFIQNVHHFRDEGLKDFDRPPVEHVALFDEAQRAWDEKQTIHFMRQKKGVVGFDQSEPGFLMSCMDRHADWAVVVCLVGGGQEINTGEAGITGWLEAVREHYPHWKVCASPNLSDREYQATDLLNVLAKEHRAEFHPELHLAVSMRSFRTESVSAWVKALIDGEVELARSTYKQISTKYPIFLTRSFELGRGWVRDRARGSERYGLVVSSQAQRLKPYAIDVKSPMDPVHWFLGDKEDVRSSYYLEDVATEFHVQGLELDWTCVAWDADLRRNESGWQHFSFRGDRWQRIKKTINQQYQLNAYRVLLTRARQGMVIVVPEGDAKDHTRVPKYYDDTFRYLKNLGLPVI